MSNILLLLNMEMNQLICYAYDEVQIADNEDYLQRFFHTFYIIANKLEMVCKS